MSADDDVIMRGGQKTYLIESDGVTEEFTADFLLLTNEFTLVALKPGQVSPDQESALFMGTFKGQDSEGRLSAVTMFFDSEMSMALIKSLRKKLMEIPIEHR